MNIGRTKAEEWPDGGTTVAEIGQTVARPWLDIGEPAVGFWRGTGRIG